MVSALPAGSPLGKLMATFPKTGTLRWIGVRPAYRESLRIVNETRCETERGIAGDHYAEKGGGKRQVTLIQFEHLAVIAALCDRQQVAPEALRRNLVISGINLLALRNQRFRIGDALFEGNGLCEPCSRMEETLGRGGYTAMRGHGGILARVIEGGAIRIGDKVAGIGLSRGDEDD